MSKQHLWKSQKEGYNDSLRYLKGRMEGVIKSIKTPWDKFNDATTDGLEWHSMTVIGGRPGSGKTLIKLGEAEGQLETIKRHFGYQ